MSDSAKTAARSGALVAFAVIAVLTLASAWRLVLQLGTSLPSDLGDPLLDTWTLWWNTQAVPLTAHWWSAPMFAPMPGAFALSEALLALAAIATPLQWLGVSPVAAHNALYLLSYPMAGAGAYALAFALTRRRDAAFVAALAFAFNPYRIAQLPHIQVQWSCWMPFALAALHDYIESRRRRSLVVFGACWMLNGFTNAYFLVYFPVLVGFWILWFARSWRDRATLLLTAFAASLPLAPMLLGYQRWQSFYGFSRQIGEIRTFSADLSAIFATTPRAWLPWHWSVTPGPEGELYPGIAILVLAVVGGALMLRDARSVTSSVETSDVRASDVPRQPAGRRTWPRRTMIVLAGLAATLAIGVMLTGGSEIHLGSLSLSVHRPSRLLTVASWLGVIALASSPRVVRAWRARSVLAFYLIAAGLMYFFALGPEPHAGATQILYKPPYAWLMYLPGFDSVRVPARFGLLMIVCLVPAAAIVLARVTSSSTTERSRLVLGGVALAVLAEGWIVMPVVALPRPLSVPPAAIAADALVLEIPIGKNYEADTLALYNQMSHGRPIVNGFSGYSPSHYYALSMALEYGDEAALNPLRDTRPLAVFVDAARDTGGESAAMVARAAGAQLIDRTDRGLWYLLPMRRPDLNPLPTGVALKPTRVTVSTDAEEAGGLTDGDPRTRWHGHINEPGDVAGDVITLEFDQPVQAGLLEFDQSLWAGSFAHDLEVVALTASGDTTLFRGSLGEATVRAAIASNKSVIVRIPLAAAAPARVLKLIAHPRGDKWTWSIGELRILAKNEK